MKKVSFIIAVAVFLSVGCSKDFLSSLQNNPNAPTSSAATPQLVLPGTLTSLVLTLNGSGPNASYEYPSVWLGYWNYAPGYSFNPTPQNYIMTSTSPQLKRKQTKEASKQARSRKKKRETTDCP